MRLIKNGDVILDGTAPRYAKEKEAFLKLETLERFEKELSVELKTLFKALKKGIYYIHRNFDGTYDRKNIYFDKPEHLSIGLKGLICAYTDDFDDNLRYVHKYQDYGVAWALTKKELRQ